MRTLRIPQSFSMYISSYNHDFEETQIEEGSIFQVSRKYCSLCTVRRITIAVVSFSEKVAIKVQCMREQAG